ncbi:MAG TPA: ribosomal protein L7/L12, partial [Nocardioides sp.]
MSTPFPAQPDPRDEPGGVRGWWRRVMQQWPDAEFTELGTHAVVLEDVGVGPVGVIRQVRRITGWDLVRAKHAVDAAAGAEEVVLAAGLSAASAEAAREALVAAGATARVAE